MSDHHAKITWQRGDAAFVDNRYSRAHEWAFDGGARVRASSSPHTVRPPQSDPSAVDPEEAFVAALSSCHMLWFLGLAAERKILVESYEDDAMGVLEKDARGVEAITRVVLRPRIVFGSESTPSASDLAALHHDAHQRCFLANSVRSEISIEPR